MIKIVLYISILLAGFNVYGQNLDQGINLFNAEKYEEAYPILLQKANEGNPRAMGLVARLFANGLGVNKDFVVAAKWAELGVKKNDAASQNILGNIHFYGFANYPIDKVQGLKLTTQAVNQGYQPARKYLAQMYFAGKSKSEIVEIEAKLVKEKTIASAQLLQDLYKDHKYKPSNLHKMIPYAMEAFKRGGISSAEDIIDSGEIVQFPVMIQAGWIKFYLPTVNLSPEDLTEFNNEIDGLISKMSPLDIRKYATLKLQSLIDMTNAYLQKRQSEFGPVEARDLIDEGWQQFVGSRGIVNEPLAQYLLEEGLRKAIQTRYKEAANVARNNLGVVLGAAVNTNVRNSRLARVHIVDGADSSYGPDNLIWYSFTGQYDISQDELNVLFARYKEIYGEESIVKKLGDLPKEFKNKPDLIIKFLISKYATDEYYRKNHQLAEQIADMYEDHYFDFEHLKEAKKWYEIRANILGLDEDERLSRINRILDNRYVKDTPNLRFAIENIFEITDTPNAVKSNKVTAENAQSVEQKSSTTKLNVSALVIGNASYSREALSNAVNDAKVMAEKFKSYGFSVTYLNNLNRKAFIKGLYDFSEKAKEADVTILYYSGHGVQLGGVNYLLPTDIDLKGSEEIVAFEGISLNEIERRYMPSSTRIIFLDACRSKPFARSQTKGSDSGLAPMNVSRGTLISYATRDGGVAFDSVGGKNSPYTSALAFKLDDKEDIAIVLRGVRDQVVRATQGRQEPWEYGSLSGGKLVLSSIAN